MKAATLKVLTLTFQFRKFLRRKILLHEQSELTDY